MAAHFRLYPQEVFVKELAIFGTQVTEHSAIPMFKIRALNSNKKNGLPRLHP